MVIIVIESSGFDDDKDISHLSEEEKYYSQKHTIHLFSLLTGELTEKLSWLQDEPYGICHNGKFYYFDEQMQLISVSLITGNEVPVLQDINPTGYEYDSISIAR